MKKIELPIKYLRSLLEYDAKVGSFTWLVSHGTMHSGKPAGGRTNTRGKTYVQIKIDKRLYKAHRIAWAMHYGKWPAKDIDHINGDSTNNSISNLRECSMSQNKANSRRYKNNTTGFKGVNKIDDGRYRAYISFNGKRQHLGYFSDLETAASAYAKAASRTHGEFARTE